LGAQALSIACSTDERAACDLSISASTISPTSGLLPKRPLMMSQIRFVTVLKTNPGTPTPLKNLKTLPSAATLWTVEARPIAALTATAPTWPAAPWNAALPTAPAAEPRAAPNGLPGGRALLVWTRPAYCGLLMAMLGLRPVRWKTAAHDDFWRAARRSKHAPERMARLMSALAASARSVPTSMWRASGPHSSTGRGNSSQRSTSAREWSGRGAEARLVPGSSALACSAKPACRFGSTVAS